ncbi:ribonuclease H-like domain-containing protein [Tanacetum coccineum]|uniref:Ribonuclease H-like domain-containing protein n=1 Tax=Tanacetum coccineum TaxID=301880 RepID=A0ABQ5C2E0_9ASTR
MLMLHLHTPSPSQTPSQQTPYTVSTIKHPILKKGEYDIWAMKMEHYLAHTDYPIWEFIQRGNGPVSVSTDTNGLIKAFKSDLVEMMIKEDADVKLHFDAKEPVGFDKTKVECYSCHKTEHFARECRSKGNQDGRRRDAWNTGNKEKDNRRISGSDTEVTSCSKECKESYAKLKKLYDEQREQLRDANSEDEHVSLPTKEQEIPSLGYGFTTKACFVCGSLSHLIRDCDFHEKMMAKQVELNKQKGKGKFLGRDETSLEPMIIHLELYSFKEIVDSGCSRAQ